MQFSHSRTELFENCKFRFKMRYIDKIKTIQVYEPDNALILGLAMHKGIENGTEAGIKLYYNSFPIINDLHINEAIKLEYWIPRVRELLPDGKNEIELLHSDFVGFIDRAVRNEDGTYDIYDFKYSNNVKNYLESKQLHLYKYFFEKQFNKTIRNLYFVFIPKVQIKQKKTEDLYTFRKRTQEELEKSSITIEKIEFDSGKVIEFYQRVKRILETKDFPKEPGYLCNWCEYQDYCEKGVEYMLLPSNERRKVEKINKKVVWLYGAPFSGKTHLANQFPDPLMLNTDGNIKFVDAPFISIKDQVVVVGRQTERTLAWTLFKDVIAELEKKQNDFKTIIVDLLEDVYEHCRVYIYDRENITHESDNSFKFYDIVRTEFLSTLRRLMNLDYENIILISHEDTTKDITKKSGDKITAIKPNLQDKVALKVAGMVDIVARVVANGDERTLSFKTNEVVFGGGRLSVADKVIPLEYDDFMKVYEEVNEKVKTEEKKPATTRKKTVKKKADSKETTTKKAVSSAQKVQEVEPETKEAEPAPEAEKPAPAPRTRKKRGE